MIMAKLVGLIGTISGKLGTTVFQKGERGLSYGRAYQPVVSNPKTEGQTDQRAKMNLVGRLSQVTPWALLMGMTGVNKRQRRSAFTRNLLKVATIDRSNPGSVIAKIAPEDVVFSQGAEVISATAATPVVTATSVSVALTLSNSALAGRYGERVVVAVVDPSDKSGYSQIEFVDVVLDGTTATTVTVGLGAPVADESLVCVYRLPFVLTDGGASLKAETLANNGVDITARLLAGGNYVQGWGNSLLAATQVFIQA